MDESPQLSGRFLPSKVYARWKWTVRFGLFAMPLILFLVGGFVLYLTPTKYESKAVFDYRGSRTPAEAAALLKSRNVQVDVCDALELNKRLDCDKETVVEVLTKNTETRIDAASGQIEVVVTHVQKELARDIAAELPKALDRYEATLARNAINRQLEALRLAIRNGEDKAGIHRKDLLQLISVRGEHPTDTASQLDVTASRIDWEQEFRRVTDNKSRAAELDLELASLGKFATVHTDPVIAQNRAGTKTEDSLTEVSLESLGYGLLFALLVPYLFELACPNHRRFITPVKKMSTLSDDEWSLTAKDSDLVPAGGNG
ncbi:MAG: hypothetical protein CFE26_02060 [Verrucomicrobiales bacterium VVV1]|nr:MAG: hypothetical protein CFE26_02060 [Verrucomicrobiales bacterium VVV1]